RLGSLGRAGYDVAEMPRSFQATHPGKKREHNEDALHADDATGIYVVCDGVGGQAKGEVASRETADQVVGFVRGQASTTSAYLNSPTQPNGMPVRRMLESAVQSACYMVYGLGELDPAQRGMATT